jgi:hypothetical protein
VANRSKLSLSGAIGFIVWLSAYVDYALTSMSEKRRADPMDSASRIQHLGAIPSTRLRSVAAGPGVGALTQRLIPIGERFGLQTRPATTESVSLCT